MFKNKKEKLASLISGVFLFNVIKLVSAASPNYYVETFIDWVNSNYGPIFAAILGTSAFDEYLFAKILVLFLIYAVVWMVLKKSDVFGNNKPILFTISAIAVALGDVSSAASTNQFFHTSPASSKEAELIVLFLTCPM